MTMGSIKQPQKGSGNCFQQYTSMIDFSTAVSNNYNHNGKLGGKNARSECKYQQLHPHLLQATLFTHNPFFLPVSE